MSIRVWIKQTVVRKSLLLGLLLITGLSTAGGFKVQAAPPQGTDTLHALQSATVPVRDPEDLAMRLLGLKAIPTPVPPGQAKTYQVGDTRHFVTLNNDTGEYRDFEAKLWYITPHVYMWFEGDFQPDLEKTKAAADTFENSIYPTDHKYFGSEVSPGIDGDVHLYIVHAKDLGRGVLGFFDPTSEYPKAVEANSNEAQVFFINLGIAKTIGSTNYLSTLAHEFQHMIQSNVDPGEIGWVDEGMSVTAELLNGYGKDAAGYADLYLKAPRLQLNTWSEDVAHYGASFLFMTYFLERFGVDGLTTLESDKGHDLAGIADALKKLNAVDPATGKPVTLEEFFADWTVANLLNDISFSGGRYGYATLKDVKLAQLKTDPAKISDTPTQDTVKQWSGTYLTLKGKGTYQITFKGQPTVRVIPTDAHSGHMLWWSNRGDRTDTRLTHSFDLTGVQKATLNYSLWYATEPNYDYGYVEVSTDAGKTWTALAGGHTVDKSDNNPYGPGYNGFSGEAEDAASAKWIQDSVDLSAYAGKKILVRFESLTDAAMNYPGIALDDISIPEIGYSTDAETDDGGWTAEGWVRMDNVLPQRYMIHQIVTGATPAVSTILAPDSGSDVQWNVTVDSDRAPVVLIVSGLTEYTTEPAPFEYSIKKQ